MYKTFVRLQPRLNDTFDTNAHITTMASTQDPVISDFIVCFIHDHPILSLFLVHLVLTLALSVESFLKQQPTWVDRRPQTYSYPKCLAWSVSLVFALYICILLAVSEHIGLYVYDRIRPAFPYLRRFAHYATAIGAEIKHFLIPQQLTADNLLWHEILLSAASRAAKERDDCIAKDVLQWDDGMAMEVEHLRNEVVRKILLGRGGELNQHGPSFDLERLLNWEAHNAWSTRVSVGEEKEMDVGRDPEETGRKSSGGNRLD